MVWGLVGYGCRLAVVAHGFGVGHSGLRQPKLTKSRVTKNGVLVVMDPPRKIITFFSSLYQCWLNCQKIFFAGNPQSLNNVRHFAKNCFWSKFRPQPHVLVFFMLQEGDTPKNIFFLLLVLCIGQLIKTIYKSCAQFAHIAHFYARTIPNLWPEWPISTEI